MAKFQPKITRARWVVSPCSAEQMQGLGSTCISSMFARWDRAENVYDAPAKPLSPGYVKSKTKKDGRPVRDLSLTGRLRRAIKVLSANENRVVIGPTDMTYVVYLKVNGKKQRVNLTVADIIRFNNRNDLQYGVSPSDKAALAHYIASLNPIKVKTSVA